MKNIKIILPYLIAPILSLIALIFFLELWKVDLTLPIFRYGYGDELPTAFYAKTIIEEGWFFSNRFVGAPQSLGEFNFYDFPLQAESFNFLILKIFSYFSSNPFVIVNSFFITGFITVSAISFIVLRSFGIGNFSATLVSILYAFTPYHFYRHVAHLFLGNYAVVPLIVMLALWISANKITLIAVNKKQQWHLMPNRFFFIALALAMFVATSGVYYAFYAIVIFGFAWFLRSLKEGRFFGCEGLTALTLCLIIILTAIYLHFPSFNYWFQNGLNSDVGNRDVFESELFGFRISNLFLPTGDHYLKYFADLRWRFFEEKLTGVESAGESLGVLAASGFLMLLLWLIAKSQSGKNSFIQKTIQRFSLNENDQSLISNLAGLNLMAVLFATIGGFVIFVAMSFSLIRSHARVSIFIAFLSLFLVAIIFDKIVQKKKILAKILVSIIFMLALFDQVGKFSASSVQSEKIKNKFHSDQDFVRDIEALMPKGAMIFMMPVVDFPESEEAYLLLAGYLHSKDLNWSYPAIKGRNSNLWQQEVVNLNFTDFISEIKKKGFSGIYINRDMMSEKYDWEELRKFEAQLKKVARSKSLVSKNMNLVFFEI